MRNRTITASVAVLILAAGNLSNISSPALAAPVCRTAPILNQTPDNSWTPTAGVSVRTWNFARGVSHNGPEATRVSVATANLESFDLKPLHSGFPTVSSPYTMVTKNNAYAAINTDFFDLSWPAFAWGPVVTNRVPEYMPLVYINGEWRSDWLKVVGTVEAIPDKAGGYTTTGRLKTGLNEIELGGLNLKTLPTDSVIVYNPDFVGKTPKGGATLVVQNGVVIESFSAGRSISVPSGTKVIQAVGRGATKIRKVGVQPSAEVKIDGPISKGFVSKGTLTAAKRNFSIVGVNLPSLKNGATIFNKNWKARRTPKGALTWVIANEKIVKVFKTGSTVKPTSDTTVVQFIQPSKAARTVVRGSETNISHSVPSTLKGYRTSGVVSATAGDIPIEAINLAVPNPKNALVFDSNWKSETPQGAITLKVQDNTIIEVDSDGNTSRPTSGQYVIQIPALLADLAGNFSTATSAVIELDLPSTRVNALTSTLIRSNSQLVVGSETIPIGAINYQRIASDQASLFNGNWLSRNRDRLTQAGKSSVVIREGKIAAIYPSGANLFANTTDTIIQFPRLFRPQVSAWTVGTPVTIELSVESKNKKDLINAFGRGRPNLNDGVIVTACDPYDDGVRPRTSIGWDAAGNVWLITGSPTGSNLDNDGYRNGGATVLQMAHWLQQLGATDAVSFDGGGSTWMMRNSPDGPRRVDMADPGNSNNPWIRPVPVSLGIVDRTD
jgi:hypothetical protein